MTVRQMYLRHPVTVPYLALMALVLLLLVMFG